MTVISRKAKIEIYQRQAPDPYFLFLGKKSEGRGHRVPLTSAHHQF